jgi:small-conductance mechanosensitive channel
MNMQGIEHVVAPALSETAIKIGVAILCWLVGGWLIGRMTAMAEAAMRRQKIDPAQSKYRGLILAVVLNVVLALGILSCFGILAMAFTALIAGAGVVIGEVRRSLKRNARQLRRQRLHARAAPVQVR